MDFRRYHDEWSNQHRQMVWELRQALSDHASGDDGLHRQLVQKVVSHHAEYCRTKAAADRRDVLALFPAPLWASPLEGSLRWVGGWRPTTAFHLIYNECGAQFESRMEEILRGGGSFDMAGLSPPQFNSVSDLQMATVRRENRIDRDLFRWQDETSNLLDTVDMGRKIEELAEILVRADELRLKTLKSVVEMLAAEQAAQFLVAAAELEFGIQNWGTYQDEQRR